MSDQADPHAHRFRSAAAYYLKGRPAYSLLLIRRLVHLCGLNETHRVMDLGCGPGPLAVALAPFVGEVVGIDPEPAMLAAAAEHATASGVRVRFIEGSSNDLGPSLGRFRAATIGRAFHWMDRARTLERLDERIETGGAVAFLGDHHPEVPDNAWRGPLEELLGRYGADDETHPRHKAPGWSRNEAVLLESPFRHLERISVIERRLTPVGAFLDRAFSMSSTAPARLGAKADELARELTELMAPCATDGMVTEVVESGALIAWRSAPNEG
jgi:SAM-dependent methyltransferase